ncbi:MAG: nucleotide exchange factor GrpE [Nocardioides marinisabuli]|uniref:nucleotide exchange factor GrpE n=1 Tax=Nocardioides marinisabuli TaxID=419476 RepID=UPI003218E68F
MTQPRDEENIPPPEGSFPDEAAEMVSETDVEAGAAGGDPATADPAADSSVPGAAGASEPADDELTLARIALEERTLDLQRLQAEFVNYKRRVERDRDLIKENATYAALAPITEVLDTIDRAREHEPLEGGFKAVAEQLERTVGAAGLTRYGAPGDPFDPSLHEALSHIGEDPEVSVTTCKVIAKAGYRIGDRVVRAAQVLVVDPADADAPAATDQPAEQDQPDQ